MTLWELYNKPSFSKSKIPLCGETGFVIILKTSSLLFSLLRREEGAKFNAIISELYQVLLMQVILQAGKKEYLYPRKTK
jgi:hypothetical protein